MRLVAFLVFEDPKGIEDRFELIDLQGYILSSWDDAKKWLFQVAPKRPDLAGRRIDIVDADERTARRLDRH